MEKNTNKSKKSGIFLVAILLSVFIVTLNIPSTLAETETLLSSYNNGNEVAPINDIHPSTTGWSAVGQSFTMPSSQLYRITSAQFYLRKDGSPSGSIQMWLYNASGGPIGDVLAKSNNVSASTLSTSGNWVSFTFSGENSIWLTPSAQYFVAVVGVSGALNGVKVYRQYDAYFSGGISAAYLTGSWSSSSSWDLPHKVYGTTEPNSGVIFSNFSVSNTINSDSTDLSFTAQKLGRDLGGYIFSWDISGSYQNDTWITFSNTTAETVTVSKTISGSPGQIVHWRIYANDNTGIWSLSQIQNFTVGATITFYYTEGGVLLVNGNPVTNGSSYTYSTATTLRMVGCENSGYGFKSFNWTNSEGSTITNYYEYVVNNRADFWAILNMVDRYDQGYADGNATSFSTGYAAGYSEGNATGYANGLNTILVGDDLTATIKVLLPDSSGGMSLLSQQFSLVSPQIVNGAAGSAKGESSLNLIVAVACLGVCLSVLGLQIKSRKNNKMLNTQASS